MTPQPELALENNLIIQLQKLGYSKITIEGEPQLLTNLKAQLENTTK